MAPLLFTIRSNMAKKFPRVRSYGGLLAHGAERLVTSAMSIGHTQEQIRKSIKAKFPHVRSDAIDQLLAFGNRMRESAKSVMSGPPDQPTPRPQPKNPFLPSGLEYEGTVIVTDPVTGEERDVYRSFRSARRLTRVEVCTELASQVADIIARYPGAFPESFSENYERLKYICDLQGIEESD